MTISTSGSEKWIYQDRIFDRLWELLKSLLYTPIYSAYGSYHHSVPPTSRLVNFLKASVRIADEATLASSGQHLVSRAVKVLSRASMPWFPSNGQTEKGQIFCRCQLRQMESTNKMNGSSGTKSFAPNGLKFSVYIAVARVVERLESAIVRGSSLHSRIANERFPSPQVAGNEV